MHRSGTSLTTRVLAALGMSLGNPRSLIAPDEIDNPEGYQEQEAIVALNDELLRALGGHASEPPNLEPGWELGSDVQMFVVRAKEIVSELFNEQPWAFKDPRASLLLPFWSMVVPNLRVLVCIRNPIDVALSMDRRGDPYPIDHWIELWERHTRDALIGSEGCEREVLIYEELVARPESTTSALAQFALGHQADPSAIALAAALPAPRPINRQIPVR
jgi:hypothetical protein